MSKKGQLIFLVQVDFTDGVEGFYETLAFKMNESAQRSSDVASSQLNSIAKKIKSKGYEVIELKTRHVMLEESADDVCKWIDELYGD